MVYNIGMGERIKKGISMKIIIYQENNPTFRVDDNKKIYNKSDYHKVYEREEQINTRSNIQILEDLYLEFNRGNYPEDYKGHSLSVGDIVEFRIANDFEKGSEKFICASCGWDRIDWEEN